MISNSKLNLNNCHIDINFIENIFHKLDIDDFHISDLKIYQQSFVHRSYIRQKKNMEPEPEPESNVVPFQIKSNEVLEFLGDSIIGDYVSRYLYERYPFEDEGFFTTLKSRIVRTESLEKFATYLGFNKYLIISSYVEIQKGRSNKKLLENTFEAFVGAIYIDQGGLDLNPYSLVLPHKFIHNVIEQTTDFAQLILIDDNYKDQLMRCFHQHFKGKHAIYKLIRTDMNDNIRTFVCGVVHPLDSEKIVSTGSGSKKPEAEQNAAKEALDKLDEIIEYGKQISPNDVL